MILHELIVYFSILLVRKMASSTILESTATFEMQATRAGLSVAYVAAIKNMGLGTLGKIAYALTTPGTSPTDAQIGTFLNGVRPGAVPTLADETAMKRLVFESQTLTIANLRNSLAESARIAGQKARIPMEPSFWLYDFFSATYESGELKYIPPGKCLTRQQELSGAKPEKHIKLDASSSGLVVKDAAPEQEINVVFQAMCRRALAMDLVGLASYDTIMKWINRMFSLYTQPPAPGFQKVSQSQLLRAALPAASAPVKEADLRDAPYDPPKKGKGKGKGKKKRTPMPSGLVGMHHQPPQGKAICYNFNLSKCQDKNCKREHVCCSPRCYKKHPLFEHA